MKRTFLFAVSMLVTWSFSARAADLPIWSSEPEDHPSTQSLRIFAEQAANVNAHASLKVLPTAAVSSNANLIAQLQNGQIGIAVIKAASVAKMVPEAKVLQLPFLFKDSRQMFAQLDGSVGDEIKAQMANKGVVVLGWYYAGTRSLFLRNRPPASLSQLSGLKVRIANRFDLRQMVSALGGKPEVLPYQDVNAALDAGTIDGAENDLLSYESSQQYKHAPFFVQSNHAVQFETLVISSVIWNKLSDSERKKLQAAAKASVLSDRDMWAKRVTAARTHLEKEGVKFIDLHDNTVLFSHVSNSYRPYIENPKTSGLLLRLMTARS